jgi:hypothetical protein
MDKQLITPMVAIDLSAAFDTVDHDILLQVLGKNFGVSGTALSWFDSYLRQRTYQVQINDKLSSVVKLDFSVPQGSCAGPILFTDYASTLASQINDFNIQIMGYADDHSLYDAFPANSRASELTTMNNLQECLVSVRDWMSRNRLKMNDEKTEFILFGNHVQLNKCNTCSIKVGEAEVNKSNSIKYLGVWLDSEMKMVNHIKEKCKVASLNLYNIRKIRKHLSIKSCKQLVQSLVMTHLDYSNALLFGLPQKSIASLQRIQNMAAKVILRLSKYDDSSTDALIRLHWLPIVYRIQYKVIITVFKSLHSQSPRYISTLLKIKESPKYSLRSSGMTDNGIVLIIPQTKCKTETVEQTTHYNAIRT